MPILAKKNYLFRWSSFLTWRVCKQAKFVAFVTQKTRTHTLKSRINQNESLFGADFGIFFFENKQDEAVTVNGYRYRAMLKEFLCTKIEEQDVGNILFQQDGAMCHTVEVILDVFRALFEDRIISRRADVVWPPHSFDLTSLNYYLWGAVKDKCYADKPETIDALSVICLKIGLQTSVLLN